MFFLKNLARKGLSNVCPVVCLSCVSVKEDLEHQCARLEQEAASKKTKLQEISDKKSADNLVADLEDQFAQVQRSVFKLEDALWMVLFISYRTA